MLGLVIGKVLLLLSLLLVFISDLHFSLRLRLVGRVSVALVRLHLQHLLELCIRVCFVLFLFFVCEGNERFAINTASRET